MNKRLLIVAGALVAGIALYFAFGRGGGGSKTTPGPTPTDPQGPIAERASGGEGRGSGDRQGRDAPEQVLIDDDPIGAIRLEGQVVDDTNDGIGGATVVLSSNPPRTTVSEDDGSFAFDHLVGRQYQIAARATAGVAGPVSVRVTEHTDPVILKIHTASAVEVEVVDDKGADVDGATVELRGLDTQAGQTKNGKVTIAPVVPGGYQIAAWAPGFARSTTFLSVAGATETARIGLRRGAPVDGKVVSDTGAPVAGARVTFYGASDWSQQPDERRDGVTTGADGVFHFDAVAAGSWRFDAHSEAYAPGSSAIISLDGVTAQSDVTITLPSGATVSGTVVDAGKVPVAGARVRIGVAKAGMVSGGPRQVFSGSDGSFKVAGLPMKQLDAVAVSDAGASSTVSIDAQQGDVANVQIVVDVTGTIAGRVVDPEGEPVEGAQVSAGPDFGSGGGPRGGDFQNFRLRGFPQDLTDADGHFSLVGLADGNYRVRASRDQRGGRGRAFMGDGVLAKTGDANVKITLPLDGGVKGKIAYEDGSAPTSFTVSINFDQQPFATKDGSFEIDDLAPKDYQLEVRGNGFAQTTVKATVTSGDPVDLGTITVHKGRTIKGVVVANGAPVANANVYAGAQLFGNGTTNQAAGGGGPPGSQNVKTATTDAQGMFTIEGLGRRDVYVVAESDTLGRSTSLRVRAGDPNEQNLTLALAPFGSMSGTVKDGADIAAGTIVSVQSVTAPGSMYGVASGDDGTFKLDRLAPDTYKVSAMTGMNPMRGMGFFSKTVTVESGKDTHVDVAIQRGTINLSVTLKATGTGADKVHGFGWIASGTIVAKNGGELQDMLAHQGEGSSMLVVFLNGQPGVLGQQSPGAYTVCASPLPNEVQGMASMQYAMNHGDQLPAFCKAVTIAATPNDQSMSIDVTIPAVIPDE